jgi:hypothetical protein
MNIPYVIISQLKSKINYLSLYSVLAPSYTNVGIFIPIVKESLNNVINFINNAKEKEIVNRGPEILNALEPLLNSVKETIPPKKELHEISSAFELLKEDDKLFSHGILFEWLDKYIDVSKILNSETPYHAHIGIGFHAGSLSLEESDLLADAFYFLVKSENDLKFLLENGKDMIKKENETYPTNETYYYNTVLKMDVCSYAKSSLIKFYSFLECFVNGVGYDYYLRNKDVLEKEKIEILLGKKNERFLSLEQKMEKFHTIIDNKNKQKFNLKDKNQLQDPFKTFIEKYKDIRDSLIHFSPKKKPIWKRPDEWNNDAKEFSKFILSVSKKFWKACYPNKEYPYYLFNLNYDECYERAQHRHDTANELKAVFQKR